MSSPFSSNCIGFWLFQFCDDSETAKVKWKGDSKWETNTGKKTQKRIRNRRKVNAGQHKPIGGDIMPEAEMVALKNGHNLVTYERAAVKGFLRFSGHVPRACP